jgi:ABC-type branched-subunit amino acid transport system substrate-binding protein
VLSTLRELGVRPDDLPVFVSDGMRVNDLSGLLGSTGPATMAHIEGTALAPRIDAPWFQNALAAAAPGVPNLYAAYAYDCTNLVALAAQLTGSDDPALLRSAMLDVSRGGAVCRDFPSCAQQLEAGRNIDLDGASGLIEFGSNGDPEFGTFDLFRFDDAGRDMTERQIPVRSR